MEQQNSELHFGRKRQDQSTTLAEVLAVGDGQCGPSIFQLCLGIQRWLHLAQA